MFLSLCDITKGHSDHVFVPFLLTQGRSNSPMFQQRAVNRGLTALGSQRISVVEVNLRWAWSTSLFSLLMCGQAGWSQSRLAGCSHRAGGRRPKPLWGGRPGWTRWSRHRLSSRTAVWVSGTATPCWVRYTKAYLYIMTATLLGGASLLSTQLAPPGGVKEVW